MLKFSSLCYIAFGYCVAAALIFIFNSSDNAMHEFSNTVKDIFMFLLTCFVLKDDDS